MSRDGLLYKELEDRRGVVRMPPDTAGTWNGARSGKKIYGNVWKHWLREENSVFFTGRKCLFFEEVKFNALLLDETNVARNWVTCWHFDSKKPPIAGEL